VVGPEVAGSKVVEFDVVKAEVIAHEWAFKAHVVITQSTTFQGG